jgi:hypothetical protein
MNDMQFRAVRKRADKSESERATDSESAARLRHRLNVRTQSGDVVQSVRTLLSHRHNDISDLKISNLVRPTPVRPVTVSAISLNFRKLVVRFLEVPDIFLLLEVEVRHVWRTVFRQELFAELFDEES